MRNKGQIKELGAMIKRVEKQSKVEFLSKEYDGIFGWQAMSFATMKKLGYLNVTNVEYYDVQVDNGTIHTYAVKGGEKVKISSNWREQEVARKLGYAIVQEKSETDIVQGKRYTYKFNIKKMVKDYNKSVIEYQDFKKLQSQELVDKLSERVERLSERLSCAENELCELNDKLSNKDYTFGLQLM